MSSYERKIKCFEGLAQIQKDMRATDNEYITTSIGQEKTHRNAWNRLEYYTNQYHDLLRACNLKETLGTSIDNAATTTR